MQDLYALQQIPDLIHLVDCFKIEGRYKDAEYVAATTSAYRQAIDDAWANHLLSIKPDEELALEGVYSRGLEPAFISGVDHQRVVVGRAPRHKGLKVGVVKGISKKGVFVQFEGPTIKPGDGLVFDAADWHSPQEREEGGRVFEVKSRGRNLDDSSGLSGVELRFGNGQIAFSRIREGDWVWRSHDPSLKKRYKKFTQPGDPVARRGIQFTVLERAGKALRLEAGIRAVVASPRVLKPNEERIHTFLLGLGASAILVRSLGLLKSLLEVIAHHHLPVFHTEHCVFCRFLSTGTDHTNCGHPCETHTVTLRDEHGLEHSVMADVGCRNTVFNAQAQSGAKYLERWRSVGIQKFRLEFAHETAEQITGVIKAWQSALQGKSDRKDLERRSNQFTSSGTTEGSLSIR